MALLAKRRVLENYGFVGSNDTHMGRGVHSSTVQLNLSALYGIGGARRGCVACVNKGGLRRCLGCVGCFVCVRHGSG